MVNALLFKVWPYFNDGLDCFQGNFSVEDKMIRSATGT